MELKFNLNGIFQHIHCQPGQNVQKLLFHDLGLHSVRDSDNGFGFAGSDAILLNGKIVNASLLIAAQLEGVDIKTAESLSKINQLNPIQQAMIDVGAVQSGYNEPAVALILTDLLTRIPNPSREDIDNAMSGIFVRDNGYQQYYEAVALVVERQKNLTQQKAAIPNFGGNLQYVGKSLPKLDSIKMVQAQPCYVEDRISSQACILKILRSPHAHAYITHIDVSRAEALSGVFHVITYRNCPQIPYTPGGQTAPEPSPLDRLMFGQKLRHVGDRVAGVVAISEEIALKALSLIKVDYEILKPVMTIEDAEAKNAPIVHDEFIEYVVGAPDDLTEQNRTADPRSGKMIFNFPFGSNPRKNIAASFHGHVGDLERGFKEADVIIERTYRSTQAQQTPVENHIAYSYMDGDRVIVHASTQVPFHVRRVIAKQLQIPQNKVHIIKERVGGGFGSKQDILVEEVCAWATFVTGKPVYFRHTREEEFICTSSRHTTRVTVKLGAKKDGMLTAIFMDFVANTGPYGNHSLTVPGNGPALALPLYPCENAGFKVTTYYSNICPNGAYQGYGAPQGNFALTMAMAELAEELGIDQMEIIEKNRVVEGEELAILGKVGEGKVVSQFIPKAASCALEEILKQGRELMKWGSPKISTLNADWKIGQGLALIQQKSGIPDIDQANCHVRMISDGTFIVHSGGADIGTGLDLVVSKLVAETLCCPIENILVLSGDTDHAPFDKGAYASSGTVFSGNAAKLAAEETIKKILEVASKLLDESVADLTLTYPGLVKGKKNSISYQKIAQIAESGTGFGQIEGLGSYITPESCFPYGANFAEVAVNVRTGEIRLEKFYALLDCGTPINPELALGQVYGASMRAIGHSMYEAILYDDDCVPITRDLKSYGAPKIGDIPRDFRALLIPSDDKVGPYGSKSISEIGMNGASPSIAAAIHDACGVWLREWHFKPEYILRGLGKF